MRWLILAVMLPSAQLGAQASAPETTVAAAKAAWLAAHDSVVQALERTPDSLFTFKPTPQARSLGQLFAHVADGEHLHCSLALGESLMIAGVERKPNSRKELLDALKTSADHCTRAYAQTDAQAAIQASFFGRQSNRLSILAMNATHQQEQFAIIATNMRTAGLVPPSSR